MCEAFNDKDIQQQIKIKLSLDPNSLLNPEGLPYFKKMC